MTRPRRLPALLALAFATGLVTAPVASADSLVFIRANNVWLANADGSGQYQVTLDGTAGSPYIAFYVDGRLVNEESNTRDLGYGVDLTRARRGRTHRLRVVVDDPAVHDRVSRTFKFRRC